MPRTPAGPHGSPGSRIAPGRLAIPLLGPDSLGFANFARGVAATWAKPDEVPAGGVVLVSQSGTVYWEANTIDARLGFALTAHTGLEATITIADVMTYALELEEHPRDRPLRRDGPRRRGIRRRARERRRARDPGRRAVRRTDRAGSRSDDHSRGASGRRWRLARRACSVATA